MVNMIKWERLNDGDFKATKSRRIRERYMINGEEYIAKDINSAKKKAIALTKFVESYK